MINKEGGAIGIGKFLEIPEINKIFQEHDIDWAGEWIIDFSVPDYEKSYFLGAWKAWQAEKANAVLDQIKEHIDINCDEDRDDDQHSYWSGYNQALLEIKAMISAGEKK